MHEENQDPLIELKASVLENFTTHKLEDICKDIAYNLYRNYSTSFMQELGLVERKGTGSGYLAISEKGKQLSRLLEQMGYYKQFQEQE